MWSETGIQKKERVLKDGEHSRASWCRHFQRSNGKTWLESVPRPDMWVPVHSELHGMSAEKTTG